MIDKDNQQTDIQFNRRQKWPRCARPLQAASRISRLALLAT
jgi:hypothetical protein